MEWNMVGLHQSAQEFNDWLAAVSVPQSNEVADDAANLEANP